MACIIGLVALCACFVTGCGGSEKARPEEARVTSPDGSFDAVMTRESIGGVLGGVYWDIFIVPKGTPVPERDNKNTILEAAVLTGDKLVWKQNHLLEVHYDMAHIEQFRNLWGSNEVRGGSWRKGDYLVEVRLAPSSSDFSFITRDGDFKSMD
jgi:hypothetical protein